MRYRETGGAFAFGLMLSACAIVSPLIDRQMNDAPIAACGAPRPAAEAAGAQCFSFFREVDGPDIAWDGGPVGAGETLIAIYKPGPSCLGRGPEDAGKTKGPRIFSHLTVTGSSSGPGRAELSVWDVHGRLLYTPDESSPHQRRFSWPAGFQDRTFSMANAANVLANPAGARIRVAEGSLQPSQVCFKSY